MSKTPTSSLTSKLPPRSVWRLLVLWAKQPPSPRARSEQNTDCCRHPGYPRDPRPDWPHPQGVPGQDRTRRSASPGHLVARSHEAHLMCPSDPQRAHHRQMQRHHLNPSPARPAVSAAPVPGCVPRACGVTTSRTSIFVVELWLSFSSVQSSTGLCLQSKMTLGARRMHNVGISVVSRTSDTHCSYDGATTSFQPIEEGHNMFRSR